MSTGLLPEDDGDIEDPSPLEPCCITAAELEEIVSLVGQQSETIAVQVSDALSSILDDQATVVRSLVERIEQPITVRLASAESEAGEIIRLLEQRLAEAVGEAERAERALDLDRARELLEAETEEPIEVPGFTFVPGVTAPVPGVPPPIPVPPGEVAPPAGVIVVPGITEQQVIVPPCPPPPPEREVIVVESNSVRERLVENNTIERYVAVQVPDTTLICVQESSQEFTFVPTEIIAQGDSPDIVFELLRPGGGSSGTPEVLLQPGGFLPSGDVACREDLFLLPNVLIQALRATGQFNVGEVLAQRFAFASQQETFIEALPKPAGYFSRGLLAVFDTLLRELRPLSLAIGNTVCSGSDVYATALTADVTLGFLEQWVGPAFESPRIFFKQIKDSQCPTKFPSAGEATEAFLSNHISQEIARSWIQADNHCWEPWQRVVEARQNRFGEAELLVMKRRGLIDPDEYNDGFRALGHLDRLNSGRFELASESIPPIPDLVRFMVRDVEDVRIVEQFDLDVEFEEKFRGDVQRWAEWQGVSEQIMRDHWRAHWLIPGPSQLLDMFHRLRRLPIGDPLRVDLDTVRTALKQQDILPFWINKTIETAFRPLTRIDVRRAFDIGELDESQINEANKDLGYSDENAQILTDFAVAERNNGLPNETPIRLFRAETINRRESERRLIALRFDQAAITKALDDAAAQQEGHSAVQLFSSGRIPRDEAAQRLRRHGLEPETFDPWLDDAIPKLRNLRPIQLFRRHKIGVDETREKLIAWGIPPGTVGQWIDEEIEDFGDHPAVARFVSGEITEVQARREMLRAGFDANLINELLTVGRRRIDTTTAAICAKWIKRRFFSGELNLVNARVALQQSGTAPQLIDATFERWSCEFAAMGKQPAANLLCRWLERGAIGGAEMLLRLRTLGWSEVDAFRLLGDCLSKISEAARKRAEKEAKDALAAARREEVEQRRLAARERVATAGQLRAVLNARKTKQRIQVNMLKAAERIRDGDDIPLDQAAGQVKAARLRIVEELGLTATEAAEIIILASKLKDRKGIVDFAGRLDAEIAAYLAGANGQGSESVKS